MFSQRVLRSSAPLLATVAIGGGISLVPFQSGPQTHSPSPPADTSPTAQTNPQNPSGPKKIFTSGLFFQDLKLESSEIVNHNTKRLRFQFADKDAVSGLRPCCEQPVPSYHPR